MHCRIHGGRREASVRSAGQWRGALRSCGTTRAAGRSSETATVGVEDVAAAGVSDAVGLTCKSAARQALGQMGLSDAQSAAANRAIGRTATETTIDIVQGEHGNVIVKLTRLGRNGYQVMENAISQDGTKTVTQYGVDAEGTVVHVDPKN